MPVFQQLMGGKRLQGVGHGADDSDAQSVGFKNDVRLGSEGLARSVHDVRADDRVFGGFDEFAGLPPAVIEIVIAEGGGVESEKIGDLEDRQSMKDRGDRAALD